MSIGNVTVEDGDEKKEATPQKILVEYKVKGSVASMESMTFNIVFPFPLDDETAQWLIDKIIEPNRIDREHF